MIAFACAQCGMKLKVQEQFAGRTAKCPTCKQPLQVPAAAAFVAPQQIDGEESSLVRAGLDVKVALGGDKKKLPAIQAPAGKSPKDRYVIEGEIARGGMGAVLRAVDRDIRREVAVKYMLDESDPRKKARFIEEAQINGQLEHPNIVPVYDLGVDAQQRPFIMMKMIKGRSLKEVLDELRAHPRQAEKEYSLGRLLNILVNVCNALGFAHARDVIHRDLKPANIMLGDFGEVYVMDWGLAKVLHADEQPMATVEYQAGQLSNASHQGKVATNRESEPDLTQEGSILGTPIYMPPEQAAGKIADIDARSDVYSLGAILYEMLTLQSPVLKEGGHLSVLLRVVEGEIIPPLERDPARTRAGKVPVELAAIAIKAMARSKEQRYATVEELRQDIERFQEGRSVSAKPDTARELVWKFVKRNKGLSAGAAASVLVLLFSTVFLLKAWIETSRAKSTSEQATKERDDRTRQAIPALVLAAQQVANSGDHASAQKQLDLVFDYEPDNAAAHLLRGQILISEKEFAKGVEEVRLYLRKEPNDPDARKLIELCKRGNLNDSGTLLGLADALQRQRAYGLANPLLAEVDQVVKERQPLLPRFQKQIEQEWPGLGKRLGLSSAGEFNADFSNCPQIKALAPLKGIPITSLILRGCVGVQDLSPLDMRALRYLHLQSCTRVESLAPLKGSQLVELILAETGVTDLSPLRDVPLQRFNLTRTRVQDLEPLRGVPLTMLTLDGCTVIPTLEPLKKSPLTYLSMAGCGTLDLTPLSGLPLTFLDMRYSGVRDVSPLKGSSRLRDLKLTHWVNDLRGLDGLKLEKIELTKDNLAHPEHGASVVRRMQSLKVITLNGVGDFPPAEFWKKFDAGQFK